MKNKVSGVEKSSNNRSNLIKKWSQDGDGSRHRFSWISIDLGRRLGANLALKIDKKLIQKGINNMMGKNASLGASWWRLAVPGEFCGLH